MLNDVLQNLEGIIPFTRSRVEMEDKAIQSDYQSQNKTKYFLIGSFVECAGLLAVVVGLSGDDGVPKDHLALWFGEPQGKRISERGDSNLVPIVRTVPIEYCLSAKTPELKH